MDPVRILVEEAKEASENSYSPYSRFAVGAALECADGRVIRGVNVENRSIGLTICAERSAFVQAISLGYKEFKALAVFGRDSRGPLPPCGACRQFISEFVTPTFPLYLSGKDGRIMETTIKDLLPFDNLLQVPKR